MVAVAPGGGTKRRLRDLTRGPIQWPRPVLLASVWRGVYKTFG